MDRTRERGNTTSLSGLDIREAVRKAQITEELLNQLNPFFDELERNIHSKWESIDLEDGASSKLLKFQLITVQSLRKLMIKKVNEGKIAAKKEKTDGR